MDGELRRPEATPWPHGLASVTRLTEWPPACHMQSQECLCTTVPRLPPGHSQCNHPIPVTSRPENPGVPGGRAITRMLEVPGEWTKALGKISEATTSGTAYAEAGKFTIAVKHDKVWKNYRFNELFDEARAQDQSVYVDFEAITAQVNAEAVSRTEALSAAISKVETALSEGASALAAFQGAIQPKSKRQK